MKFEMYVSLSGKFSTSSINYLYTSLLQGPPSPSPRSEKKRGKLRYIRYRTSIFFFFFAQPLFVARSKMILDANWCHAPHRSPLPLKYRNNDH